MSRRRVLAGIAFAGVIWALCMAQSLGFSQNTPTRAAAPAASSGNGPDARAETQAAMLARAAGWLKPGGSLVYAVCSLERQEGERVVAAFLDRRDDYRLDEEHRLLPGRFEAEGGADSFFIARLTRPGP